MFELSLVQKIAVAILPVLFAITLHEVAHGWIAYKLGDPTAKLLGRLTLNPIKHIDPIGTILVPGALLILGGFIFGWAKPVPVSATNLRKRSDMALVAAAGPMANLIMALGWGVIGKLGLSIVNAAPSVGLFLILMSKIGVFINLVLAALNLLPLPPLDGGRILTSLLPWELARIIEKIEPYGFFIILFLIVTGILATVLQPIILFFNQILSFILGS